MMNAVLFDLDGTIADSAEGIINSVNHALCELNADPLPDHILRKFLGPPLWESFPMYCNFDEETTKEAVRYYREYYSVHGIYEQHVYPGMEELIRALYARNVPLFVATAKPDLYAGKILERMELDQLFIEICGASADNSRADKTSIIGHVLTQHDINPKRSWMIGDKEHDIMGAKKHSLQSIACAYGYGTAEEYEIAQPTLICHSVQHLKEIVLALDFS